MSTRFTTADNRWFSDRRPRCIIENEHKKKLGAKNDFEYAALLQQKGMEIFNETIRKKPKITVTVD